MHILIAVIFMHILLAVKFMYIFIDVGWKKDSCRIPNRNQQSKEYRREHDEENRRDTNDQNKRIELRRQHRETEKSTNA